MRALVTFTLLASFLVGLSSAWSWPWSTPATEHLRALHGGHKRWTSKYQLLRDLAQLSDDEEEIETLVTLLSRRLRVLSEIAHEQPVTIFAPTDAAFENISLAPFKYYYNADVLDGVLRHHVLPKPYTAQEFIDAGTKQYTTLNMSNITVRPEGSNVFIDSAAASPAQVVDADFELSEGSLVHFIDAVLVPPGFPKPDFVTIAEDAGLTELLNALEIAGLTSYAETATLKGLTLFAPTNEAFEKAAEENNIEKNVDEEFFTDALQRVLGDEAFETVLKNHLATSLMDSADLEAKAAYRCSRWYFFHWWCDYYKNVRTLSKIKLNFRVQDDETILVLFGENFSKTSLILGADFRSLVGIAHVIDTVIIP